MIMLFVNKENFISSFPIKSMLLKKKKEIGHVRPIKILLRKKIKERLRGTTNF